MKKLSLFALAAAGMLFGACSSDNEEVVSQKLNQYDMIEGQSAWISVGIALPGDPITRSNHDLNDGDPDEFAVMSAKLVLFKGASEDEAELVKDYDIAPGWADEAGDQVPNDNNEGTEASGYGEVTSTSTKIVQEIEAPSLGAEDNLYAYVILNWDGNTTGLGYTPGTKFSAFKETVLKAIGIKDESKGFGDNNIDKTNKKGGLVMTNVPIADAAGGDVDPSSAKVTTLAKINKDAIYTSKAAAETGTSVACIYVERAAVKVEVENKTDKIELEGVTGGLDFTLNGWALGNVNSSATGYYNTRQFDTEWLPYMNEKAVQPYLKYRMVGKTQFFEGADHTKAFRTYFGRDVNYDGNTGLIGAQLADADYTLVDKAYTYTYENTFDENSQIWKNTTYVGFKVTISGGDFYTIDGQPNTMLKEADIPGQVAKNAGATILGAKAIIEAAIAADLSSTTSTLNKDKTGDDVLTSISFGIEPAVTLGERSATDGSVAYTYKLELKDVKGTTKGGTTAALADADLTKLKALTDVAAELAKEYTGSTDAKIYKYVGGVNYYSARIAHFGDVETPWSAPAEAYNVYDKIYPMDGKSIHETPVVYGASRAAAWLGRWGIVRNNWYRLTIDEIKGLGSPVPEDYSGEAGGTPDDNPKPKYYIAAHVHILPWAVRYNSIKF